MRRFDLFVRLKARPRVEEELLEGQERELPLASVSEVVPVTPIEYSAYDYYITGKKAIEEIQHRCPDGNHTDADATSFKMALRALTISAEKYQGEDDFDNAHKAWECIERFAVDPDAKSHAQVCKRYCAEQLSAIEAQQMHAPRPPGT